MIGPTVIAGAQILAPLPLPLGTALGLADGRIVAVGPEAQVRAALPSSVPVVDLSGRTVAPGFIDAHLHPLPLAFFEHHVDLEATTDLGQVLDLLADRAHALDGGDDPDGWVLGLSLDAERLAERRLPTRAELDRVGGPRPVLVLRRDGHHAVGSSAALAAAGIERGTPDPPGGVIHRDATGELTGLCGETAASLLLSAVPVPPWDDLAAAMGRVVARLASHGITGITAICQTSDVGPSGAAGALEAVAWSGLLAEVPLDVQTVLVSASSADLLALRASDLHQPDRGRRLDGVKLFLDGTLGGHTACMHQPFADAPGAGMLTLDVDDAYAAMVDAHTADLQICVHAIGDRANATAVTLFERLLAEHPVTDHRHRIEHASVVDPSTVERMSAAGITAVVQPLFIESERTWLGRRLGPDRLAHTYPFRSLLDAGVALAGSSDAPVESVDVLRAMAAATGRHGIVPAEALSAAEALALYTSGAARARRVEHEAGAIDVGRRADLVVLSADPTQDLARTEVVATIAGGRVIHGADALPGGVGS